MTVKELIDKLKEFNPDLLVWVTATKNNYGYSAEVDNVEESGVHRSDKNGKRIFDGPYLYISGGFHS